MYPFFHQSYCCGRKAAGKGILRNHSEQLNLVPAYLGRGPLTVEEFCCQKLVSMFVIQQSVADLLILSPLT